MTQEVEVTLPKLGESILSATVVQWFKEEGDHVSLDEPLLEVATDKVNSEIPSPVAGTLSAILAQPDQELSVGDPLARILEGKEAPKKTPKKETTPPKAPPQTTPSKEKRPSPTEKKETFLSPAVLRIAQEKGLSLSDLEHIEGTGTGGRVTKRDVEHYFAKEEEAPPLPPQEDGQVERIKMTGMRKAIAENMVRSFYQAPHATLIAEVDVTKVMREIKKQRENFLAKHGAKLTITSFVARAITRALKEFPYLNASLDKDTIVVKHFINLGIAVSVEHGLLVPVIRGCEHLDLPGFTKAVQNIASKARSNSLSPDDITDGTITLTNFGMSGVLMGTPIIRYPEVAIIGLGAVHDKITPLDEEGVFAIRSVINVSLTFDHRVLDGMYGCGFLGALKKHLEQDIDF